MILVLVRKSINSGSRCAARQQNAPVTVCIADTVAVSRLHLDLLVAAHLFVSCMLHVTIHRKLQNMCRTYPVHVLPSSTPTHTTRCYSVHDSSS